MADLEAQQQFRLEERRLQIETHKVFLDGLKLVLGTVLLGIVTAYLPHIIEKLKLQTQQAKDERDYVSEFIKYALVEDIEARLRFSLYFSQVTPDEKQRALWKNYHESISKLREALNTQKAELIKAQKESGVDDPVRDEKLRQIERQQSALGTSAVMPNTFLKMPDSALGGTKAGRSVLEQALTEANRGVREVPLGSNDGPDVRKYLRSVGLQTPMPWSGAFVFWCLQKAGEAENLAPTGSFAQLYAELEPLAEKVDPKNGLQPGDLLFVDLGRGGHGGVVYAAAGGDEFVAIEGNTNDGGSREGVGVFARQRRISAGNQKFLRLKDKD